ncbi:MAG: DNA-protecting protein DprA [Bacteroides sp.]|nr:DNA-protecting protein DprA [Eubacterium sp.]MCM1419603.1 DNA-protecting protein DprA [Roseburia sp.]MCM1463572.1 DNA-protecting protein DprA [Bacteroides sp.]
MDKLYLLWLVMALGAGDPLIAELISRFGSGEAVYRAFRENTALAGREAAEHAAAITLDEAGERLAALEARGIKLVPIGSAFYPEPLTRLENPPCLLFVRGNEQVLGGKLLSTAGSRDITPYTMEVEDRLCARLCRRYTLVGSLSYGCDALSCLCALKAHRPFVEILPCGFDHEYPEGSRVLRDQLLRLGGCIVTELLPETKPTQGAFRRRARIVGGISRALLIFQAGTQSGALSAAEYAGRVFFLPPHNIFAKEYAGTAAFVRAGASLLFDERDLADAYIGEYRPKPIAVPRRSAPSEKRASGEAAFSPDAAKAPPERALPARETFDSELHYLVYQKIAESAEPIPFDLIFWEVSCEIANLNEILLDLELSDLIRPLRGGRFEVCG